MKIFISTSTFGEYITTPLRMLEEKGFKVELNPYRRKLVHEEVVELARDAVGIIAGTETLDAAVLEFGGFKYPTSKQKIKGENLARLI